MCAGLFFYGPNRATSFFRHDPEYIPDIHKVVQIHCSTFVGFFLSSKAYSKIDIEFRIYYNISVSVTICKREGDEIV